MQVQTVIDVHHWTSHLFSFKTTRDDGLRFLNGQFLMIGLEVGGRPLMRAYSIVSANFENYLEFLSIKVPDGALTSHLQQLAQGDLVIIGGKPTGTLVLDDLRPGRHLYLFSTGTGLAPFLSIVKDIDVYERFEKVVLVHCARRACDLVYARWLSEDFPCSDFGALAKSRLYYYPVVTREPFKHRGRITDLAASGVISSAAGLGPLDPRLDRVMICGNPAMLADMCTILDAAGFEQSLQPGTPGDYVIEKAFATR